MWENLFRQLDRNGNVKRATFRPLAGWVASRNYYGGGLVFSLNPDSAEDVTQFAQWDVVEHWWRNEALGVVSEGGGFVRHQSYIFREREIATDDNGVTRWTGYAYHPWTLLNTRRILFDAKTVHTLFEGVGAFTIAHTLISENTADTLGRWRDGSLVDFVLTSNSPSDAGPITNAQPRGGMVGEAVERVLDGLRGYAVLAQTGTNAWAVTYRAPYFGNDFRDSVVFSLGRGNMQQPRLRLRTINRPTVGLGVGAADGDARVLSGVRTGASYSVRNDVEGYFDVRDVEQAAQLDNAVDQRLTAERPREEFTFQVVQTADTFYSGGVGVGGRNTYDLGDVVTAEYYGTHDCEVTGVEVRGGDVTQIVVQTDELIEA